LFPPVVSVPDPKVTTPAPASEPTVFEKPFRSNVAPEATVSADELGTALFNPRRRAPPLTVVVPV
jgi:hypothetical protein